MVSQSPTIARRPGAIRRIVSWWRIAALIALLALVTKSAFDLLLTFRASSHASAVRNINTARAYGNLPLSFEANQGQTDKHVKFLSRGPGYALFLTPTEAVLSLNRPNGRHTKEGSFLPVTFKPKTDDSRAAVLRVRLGHANANPEVSGIDELPGKSNYFIGKDPAKWRRNIATFRRVKYRAAIQELIWFTTAINANLNTISWSRPEPTRDRLNSILPAPSGCGSILSVI